MKKITKYSRPCTIAYLKVSAIVLVIAFLGFPNFKGIAREGENLFQVTLNGETVGEVGSEADAEAFLTEARARLARERKELVFVDANLQVKGREVMAGKTDSYRKVTDRMYQVLKQNLKETLKRSYTVKINDYTVNIDSSENVQKLLQAALDKYDTQKLYGVNLVLDPARELNVLTTEVSLRSEQAEEKMEDTELAVGAGKDFTEILNDFALEGGQDFDDFSYGLINIGYVDSIEVVEAYLPEGEITPLDDAISYITKDQEKNTEYEVAAGDTLSEISLTTNVPLDKIIEMNETLEDENSTIRVGDKLIVTIPEPELSVQRQEEVYYEEDYDEEIQYIYNDEWYTTDTVTRQQPSAGHRKVVAIVTYRNSSAENTEILKEEVTVQAVPKIVEKGTKTPPTYIKPISGGRMSSVFGRRWGRMHKGIDWSTPVGTAVAASSSGTIARAGWASGYGYVIYINHADGRQTRYGHLSKILVKAGDKVSQGQKIALSGNTGRSTGPHIHFEILINGSQVNPMDYLN